MAEQEITFGPNAWLVDEMYEQYRADPSSVSESWRDFFADESDGNGQEPLEEKEPVQTDTSEEPPPKPEKPKAKPKPKPKAEKEKKQPEAKDEAEKNRAEPIRGAAARIVENMEA